MKKNLLFFLTVVCLSLAMVYDIHAQNWSDYVFAEKGDTVVIKSFAQSGGLINTVFHAIMGDTTATGDRTNPNRIYETQRGQVYMYDGPAKIDATVPNLKIIAKEGTDQPPLHIKTTNSGGSVERCFFEFTNNVYFENQYFCLAVTTDVLDRYGFNPRGENQLVEFNNCIVELTNWAILGNWVINMSVKFTNCLFINIGHEASLEKGVVVDGNSIINELYLENNTFLNFGSAVLTRPNSGVNMAYVNHNTFVNSTNQPLLFFSQVKEVLTNNLFINTGVVPDYPGFYEFFQDEDKLPKGIVNVDTVEAAWKTDHWPADYPYPVNNESDRKILVDRNNAWWDAKFKTMFDSQLPDPAPETWNDQKITMNTRTKSMFDDNTSYPYFAEGTWFNLEPDFKVNNDNIIDDWVSFIVSNSTPGNPNGGDLQPSWRTNEETNLTQVDWPVLADLSYTQADLKKGALNQYPLGDLNWFPNYKDGWEKTSEHDTLIARMEKGQIPQDYDIAIVGINQQRIKNHYSDIQVFPNPCADFASIKFNLAKSSEVNILVYNTIGEKVIIKNTHFNKGDNEYIIDMSKLDPGMYIIQLNTAYNNAGLTTKITVY